MKKVLCLLMLLCFASLCFAADFDVNLKISTGSNQLDKMLKDTNDEAATPTGAAKVKTDLTEKLSVADREMKFLSEKGFTLAEIELIALLAQKSNKTVDQIVTLHSRGIGWGVFAKRLGVTPDSLMKLLVQKMKAMKKMEEKAEGKGTAPAPKMEENKGMRQQMPMMEQNKPMQQHMPIRMMTPNTGGMHGGNRGGY